MTDEELARIRTFSLRGHEADGTMYPGGSLAALQGLLAHVDELRAKLAAAGLAEGKPLFNEGYDSEYQSINRISRDKEEEPIALEVQAKHQAVPDRGRVEGVDASSRGGDRQGGLPAPGVA